MLDKITAIISSITAVVAIVVPLITKRMEIKEMRRERFYERHFSKRQIAFSDLLESSSVAINHPSPENIENMIKCQHVAILYSDKKLSNEIRSFINRVIHSDLSDKEDSDICIELLGSMAVHMQELLGTYKEKNLNR